jgi:hypothetical protein
MKRTLLSLVVALAIGFSFAGGISANSENHFTPPERGTKNCKGQYIAFLAQNDRAPAGPGLGNVAVEMGEITGDDVSVKDIMAMAEAYCNGAP